MFTLSQLINTVMCVCVFCFNNINIYIQVHIHIYVEREKLLFKQIRNNQYTPKRSTRLRLILPKF